jgi:predicted  nucleic acid-binding Zn-ribbon protein
MAGDVKASPEDQLRLLEVQALDSALDRLAHRRRTLPELAQIEAFERQIGELDDRIVVAETEDSDLGREQAKLETDIDVVRGRMARDQQRLDAGQVASPRELENLQSEIVSLHRRQTDLEDAELEFMEKREELGRATTALRVQRDDAERSLSDAAKRRDETLGVIADEESAAQAQRESLTTALPSDLLALYDKMRASSAGVGAAALHRGRCEGCHLALNTTDLNTIRDAAPDEVIRCEECRRILVRTAESGL